MEPLLLRAPLDAPLCGVMTLPVSKSLLARVLLLSQMLERSTGLEDELYTREDLPEDIEWLIKAFADFERGGSIISVGESGTAMRFMTAYLSACTKRAIRLEGLGRQHERPIHALVDGLRGLGAEIKYLERSGYPPLLISPSLMSAKRVELDASCSSQFLSAMLLIAPLLEGEGYEIDTRGWGIVSAPYAEMTLGVLSKAGFRWVNEGGLFRYLGGTFSGGPLEIEADWSAASYAYELLCLSPEGGCLELPRLRRESLQGDARYLPEVFASFGVETEEISGGIRLSASPFGVEILPRLEMNCADCPDLVPTIVASCVGRSRAFALSGVEHLRIKESDRLEALVCNCRLLGVELLAEADVLRWDGVRKSRVCVPTAQLEGEPPQEYRIKTFGDHRMAMALAPLLAREFSAGIWLDDGEVVGKSFPRYWDELARLGYTVRTNWEVNH